MPSRQAGTVDDAVAPNCFNRFCRNNLVTDKGGNRSRLLSLEGSFDGRIPTLSKSRFDAVAPYSERRMNRWRITHGLANGISIGASSIRA